MQGSSLKMSVTGRPSEPDGRWTPMIVVSFISMCLLSEFVAASYTTITIAVPTISTHFATIQGGWLLSGAQLIGAVACPLLGKMADLYGKRRMVLIALALAAVGSLVSLTAQSFLVMVVGRCFVGFAIAAMFLAFSLIRDVYPPRIVPMAVSMAAAGTGLLLAVLPFVAGWLLTTYGFRGIFACELGVLVLLLVLIRVSTPETPLRKPASLDIVGGVLLSVGIACVLAVISMGKGWGWTSAGTISLFAAGLVILIVYGFWSVRVSEPVLDLMMFVRRPLLMTVAAGALAYGSLAVATTLLPVIAQSRPVGDIGFGLGMTPNEYAALAAPLGLATAGGGFLTGKLVPRLGARRCLLLALSFLFLGGVSLVFLMDTYWQLVVPALLIGLGAGSGMATVPNLIIENSPAEDLGAVTGNVHVAQGAFTSVSVVLMFAILGANSTVTEGGVLYARSGFQINAIMLAGIAAIGGLLMLTVFSPRHFPGMTGAQDIWLNNPSSVQQDQGRDAVPDATAPADPGEAVVSTIADGVYAASDAAQDDSQPGEVARG